MVRYFSFGFAIFALLASMSSCTFVMCHPYQLVGLCAYVGSDGLPYPKFVHQ